jgi:hypothetical protein
MTERDKIKQRIAKLLNLTTDKGASEAEAMLAGLNVVLSVKSSAASSANWRRLSVCFRATPRASSQGRRPQQNADHGD